MKETSKIEVGQRFGKIITISRSEQRIASFVAWNCLCDCGKQFLVRSGELSRGRTNSCGCARRESITKHGNYRSPTYKSWANMKARCLNPKQSFYKDYGARGSAICKRWIESFPDFLSDMGERPSKNHSIDRIDPNGNYDPDNCRWATQTEQNNNKRITKKITLIETTLSVNEWSRLMGLGRGVIAWRLKDGWRDVDAVFTKTKSKTKWSGELI